MMLTLVFCKTDLCLKRRLFITKTYNYNTIDHDLFFDFHYYDLSIRVRLGRTLEQTFQCFRGRRALPYR